MHRQLLSLDPLFHVVLHDRERARTELVNGIVLKSKKAFNLAFCSLDSEDDSAKQVTNKEAYLRALESGKTKDKRVKIQVIGQDRVGKTSLVRALKGEPVRDKEVSTDGVEMSQPLKNAGKQPWKNAALPKDTTVYHHRVAEYIKSSISATTQQLSFIHYFRTGLCYT